MYISPLKITSETTGDEVTGYKASFTYDYASDGAASQEYVLIIAAYNTTGALVGVEFVDSTLAVGTSGNIITHAVDAGADYTYKAMLWDGFSTLEPLVGAVTQ